MIFMFKRYAEQIATPFGLGHLLLQLWVTPGTCGSYLLELYDSYGDGWNGGYIDVILNGVVVDSNITMLNGSGPESTPIPIDSGDILDVIYYPDQWPEENSYTIYDNLEI